MWTINDVSVDPYPFNAVKRVWIDPNKKGYGSTKMSFTVHNVGCASTSVCNYLIRVTRSWQVGGDFASKAAQTYIIL